MNTLCQTKSWVQAGTGRVVCWKQLGFFPSCLPRLALRVRSLNMKVNIRAVKVNSEMVGAGWDGAGGVLEAARRRYPPALTPSFPPTCPARQCVCVAWTCKNPDSTSLNPKSVPRL